MRDRGPRLRRSPQGDAAGSGNPDANSILQDRSFRHNAATLGDLAARHVRLLDEREDDLRRRLAADCQSKDQVDRQGIEAITSEHDKEKL